MIVHKIGVWNVRGLNNPDRAKEVQEMIYKNSLKLVGLVETKVKERNISKVARRINQWCMVSNIQHDPRGRIWILWDPEHVKFVTLECIDQVIHGKVTVLATMEEFLISVIYARNDNSRRRELWEFINNTASTVSLPWAQLGDFNACKSVTEKIGGTSLRARDVRDFAEVVQNNQLEDIKGTGAFYSWSNRNEGKRRTLVKLDRVLINQKWSNSFPHAEANFLQQGVSDHSPIIIQWFPAPETRKRAFKFFNHWTKHPGFDELLTKVWSTKQQGNPMIKLYNKLKNLRHELRAWSRSEFPNLAEKAAEGKKTLERIQENIQQYPLDDNLAEMERTALAGYMESARMLNSSLAQKAKLKWELEGDENTAYFHAMVKGRRKSNTISSLEDENGDIVTDQKVIAEMAVEYYKSLIGQEDTIANSMKVSDYIKFEKLVTSEQAETMSKPVTDEEIKDAICSIPHKKSPGPDGFNSYIFKKYWQVVGADVCAAVRNFFEKNKLYMSTNATILTLVPKKKNPSTIMDYRPIACCNVVYKGIAKILVQRMKGTIESLVSKNQVAFLKGRDITENIIMAHELLRSYGRKDISRRSTLKIDIRKAYDFVKWDFITQVLDCMGFPTKIIDWIQTCMSTVNYSISVNGNIEGFFAGKRGLRQGDPLSPLLFVLAMEAIGKLLEVQATLGKLSPHPKCEEPFITHLSFADDILIFCEPTLSSGQAIKTALHTFHKLSGLEANPLKSSILVGGGTTEENNSFAQILQMPIVKPPLTYLGLPLTDTRLHITDCRQLIERIEGKLMAWSSQLLSYAGRLQLINAVITSTQVYWCRVFLLPKTVLKCIARICAKFLWAGKLSKRKRHPIKWKKCCKPKKEGGLGIINMEEWNRAAIGKLLFTIAEKKKSLWNQWAEKHLIKDKHLWSMPAPHNCSFIWRGILDCRDEVQRYTIHQVTATSTISFWHEPWIEGGILRSRIQRADRQRLPVRDNTKLSDLIENGKWNLPATNNHVIAELWDKIRRVDIQERGYDKILWCPHPQGIYTVKTAYHTLRERGENLLWTELLWNKSIMPKHAMISWLAVQNLLATQEHLYNWGMLQQPNCVLCNFQGGVPQIVKQNAGGRQRNHPNNQGSRNKHPPICWTETDAARDKGASTSSGSRSVHETINHLFFDCKFSKEVWHSILSWGGKNRTVANSKREWKWIFGELRGNGFAASFLKAGLCATVYYIWQERNTRIFDGKTSNPEALVKCIQDKVRSRCGKTAPANLRNRNTVEAAGIEIQLVPKVQIWCKWHKPTATRYCLNTDGSLLNGKGGYGGVIRNTEGDEKEMYYGGTEIGTVIGMELIAIKEGIAIALEKGYTSLEIRSDSLNAVSNIKGVTKPTWRNRNIVRQIQEMISRLEYMSIQHCYRECNQLADFLAGLCKGQHCNSFYVKPYEEKVCEILSRDAAGTLYLRE